MNRVKEAFWRIGSADAVAWLSFWLTFVAVVIGSFTVMPTGASWASRLAIFGIGQLILWAPLFLARTIALRMNPDRRTPIAFVVLGAYLFGATIRTLFVGSAFIWLIGPEEGRWLGRASGSFGTMAIVFAITAYVVSSAREQRRRIQDLEEIQIELEQSVADARVDIDERGERSVQQVRAILETELEQLKPVDAGGGVQSLERLARDVVRPLSHELADAAASQPEQTPRTRTSVSWWKVLDLATRGKPFRPLAVSLPILVTAIGAIAAYPPGVLRFFAVSLVTFVVLSAIDPLAARALHRRSLRVRLIIVLIAAAVAGVVVGACAFLLMWDQPVRVGISVATVFFVVVLSLAVAMVSAISADRQIVIVQLEAAESQLRRNLALVNQVNGNSTSARQVGHLNLPPRVSICAWHFRRVFSWRRELCGGSPRSALDAVDSIHGTAGFHSGPSHDHRAKRWHLRMDTTHRHIPRTRRLRVVDRCRIKPSPLGEGALNPSASLGDLTAEISKSRFEGFAVGGEGMDDVRQHGERYLTANSQRCLREPLVGLRTDGSGADESPAHRVCRENQDPVGATIDRCTGGFVRWQQGDRCR